MRYPVDVVHGHSGFIIYCRDLPEVEVVGKTRESALTDCPAEIMKAFETYFSARNPIPMPSLLGETFVEMPASLTAKVLLLNEIIRQEITNAELAKRMGLSRQDVTRILDLSHTTKIDTIQKALLVLGKRLELHAD